MFHQTGGPQKGAQTPEMLDSITTFSGIGTPVWVRGCLQAHSFPSIYLLVQFFKYNTLQRNV